MELIDIVEKRRLENKEAFDKGYLDPEMPYSPCSMSPAVSVKYNYFITEYKDKPDFLYSNVAENQVLELKEKAESIPHPVSLLLKTFVLSSIIVLFAYIPLNNLLENNVKPSSKTLRSFSKLKKVYIRQVLLNQQLKE